MASRPSIGRRLVQLDRRVLGAGYEMPPTFDRRLLPSQLLVTVMMVGAAPVASHFGFATSLTFVPVMSLAAMVTCLMTFARYRRKPARNRA